MSHDVLDTMIASCGMTADGKTAEAHYQAALQAEANGERASAVQELRKAGCLQNKSDYQFKLAYLLDLLGEEDEAVALYEQLCSRERPHINVLLNLAVIYEDRGAISEAEWCLKQILDTNPNHERARLYMKDVQASKDMYYDEEKERDLVRRSALLNTPVTDFELSVRARNCLKKMCIRTLGDLLHISAAELLNYKNFGDASLEEIRIMLASKGLRIGQSVDGRYSRARSDSFERLRGSIPEAVLHRPVSVLDLSVRARKALQLLDIQTLEELAVRSEAELMGVKNFGLTCLNEIKTKLAKFGLRLRAVE